MSKKILLTATELHLSQFWVPHIENFINHGFSVDIICSNVSNKVDILKQKLEDLPVKIDVVDLARSPFKFSNINGYKKMKKLLADRHYDIIMTNEPVMGVVTRLVAKKYRKTGTKVLYTAHGFHFFTGATKLNWIVFYPIEKWLSKYTDALVTINTEDFDRARRKFKAENTYYIHGIGVNTDKLEIKDESKDIRSELKLDNDDFVVLSIGELNDNKNHQVVIRALGELRNDKIKYIICGKGEKLEYLSNLAAESGVSNNVFFLGYRNDIAEICRKVDLFVFPSIREGLGLAPIEAMYCGLPVVASKIRGPVDFMMTGKNGETCSPYDCKQFAKAIKKIMDDPDLKKQYGTASVQFSKPFCINSVKDELFNIVNNL